MRLFPAELGILSGLERHSDSIQFGRAGYERKRREAFRL